MGRRNSVIERVELKLSSRDDRPAQWFLLEIVRGPESWFARLNSALPPLSELEEAAWDEHLHNNSARREMFMRLLRAEARLEGMSRRWPCVMFSQRPDFGVSFASPNIEELTGFPRRPGPPGRGFSGNWSMRPTRRNCSSNANTPPKPARR